MSAVHMLLIAGLVMLCGGGSQLGSRLAAAIISMAIGLLLLFAAGLVYAFS